MGRRAQEDCRIEMEDRPPSPDPGPEHPHCLHSGWTVGVMIKMRVELGLAESVLQGVGCVSG